MAANAPAAISSSGDTHGPPPPGGASKRRRRVCRHFRFVNTLVADWFATSPDRPCRGARTPAVVGTRARATAGRSLDQHRCRIPPPAKTRRRRIAVNAIAMSVPMCRPPCRPAGREDSCPRIARESAGSSRPSPAAALGQVQRRPPQRIGDRTRRRWWLPVARNLRKVPKAWAVIPVPVVLLIARRSRARPATVVKITWKTHRLLTFRRPRPPRPRVPEVEVGALRVQQPPPAAGRQRAVTRRCLVARRERRLDQP